MTQEMNGDASINPGKLLDWAIEQLCLKNDAALSRELGVTPPAISKLRNKRMPLGPLVLLRIHELTGAPTRKLRAIMGDTRNLFFSNCHGKQEAAQ